MAPPCSHAAIRASLALLLASHAAGLPGTPLARRAAIPRMSLPAHCAFSQLEHPPPLSVLEALERRGAVTTTPIQAISHDRIASGDHLLLHAETGSGKTLAMLLPALHRTSSSATSKILILSPTRELAAQLADETAYLLQAGALGEGGQPVDGCISLIAPGHSPSVNDICKARVIVSTPPELCLLLAEPAQVSSGGVPSDARELSDCLAEHVRVLILDEVDALVPGLKDFRGKRHFKWLDKASARQKTVRAHADQLVLLPFLPAGHAPGGRPHEDADAPFKPRGSTGQFSFVPSPNIQACLRAGGVIH